MTDTPPKHSPKKPSNDEGLKYGYSIKLNSSETSSKEKHIEHEPMQQKEALGKVATAKISADEQAHTSSKNFTSIKKNNLPAKIKDIAVGTLQAITKQNMNSIAKSFLGAGDKFISFIIYKNKGLSDDVVSKARPPIVFGIWVIILTFCVGGIWSGLAPLDSSASAQGFVVVASKKQIIQHREGGIIEAIYVKEGEHVQAGQALLKLSDKTAKAQLDSFHAQKEAYSKQLTILQSHLESMTNLYEKGFVQKDRLLTLQTQEAQTLGHLSDIDARLLTTEESIDRITVKAPVSGTVNQLQVNTIGGTVNPGMTLMTIIPKEDDLIIEAYLQPQEIESVYVGLPAKVRISAFKSRTTAPLNGVVTFISSDVVEPPQYQAQEMQLFQHRGLHYKIKISIDKKELRNISKYRDLELYPGMVADVMIVTGERTLLQYLLDPVTNTFWHAFIEK